MLHNPTANGANKRRKKRYNGGDDALLDANQVQNNAAGQGGHNNFVPVAVWGRGRGAPGRGAPGRGAPGRGMPFRGRPARQRSNRPIVYLTGKGDLPPWKPKHLWFVH